MIVKQAEINNLVKIANNLECLGYYKEAAQVDGLIKEAGIWNDFYQKRVIPIIGYIKNWGVERLSSYMDENPDSAVTKIVRYVMNRPDNPTPEDISDFVNESYTRAAEEVKTEAEPIPMPATMSSDTGIVETINAAINAARSLRLRYKRKYDEIIDLYAVRPIEIKTVNKRYFDGSVLWAEHEGLLHSFLIDRIEMAQLI